MRSAASSWMICTRALRYSMLWTLRYPGYLRLGRTPRHAPHNLLNQEIRGVFAHKKCGYADGRAEENLSSLTLDGRNIGDMPVRYCSLCDVFEGQRIHEHLQIRRLPMS